MENWGPTLTAIGAILTPIGLGFGWLIKEIVSTSKAAVKELKDERDIWQQRAIEAGWKGEKKA